MPRELGVRLCERWCSRLNDLLPLEIQLVMQVIQEQHRTADRNVVPIRGIIHVDEIRTVRRIEPDCRAGVAIKLCWVEQGSEDAGEPFPITGSAVPPDALGIRKHLNLFGNHQHARVVDVQARHRLCVAVQIGCSTTEVKCSPSTLS